MTRAGWFSIVIVSLLAPASAVADEPVAPQPSAPSVSLTVIPANAAGPWKVRIENTGDLPVRLAADPRLLSFEITAANPDPKAKPNVCVLPDDARPTTDEGRELVVPPKRSWSIAFDPLYYCFGKAQRAALVAGAVLHPRFGWPLPKPPARARAKSEPVAPKPPFALVSLDASGRPGVPSKQIEGTAFALSEEAVPRPTAAPSQATDDKETPIEVTSSEALDVASGGDLPATVTIANRSERALSIFMRPNVVGFSVNGPAGTVKCGSTRNLTSPIREFFATLGANAKTSLAVLLSATCPTETFDQAGVYRVTTRIDTTGTSGRPIGLRSWDGVASSKVPMLVRIRNPRQPVAGPKPNLD